MATVKHGFDLDAIRKELDGEEWESDDALGGDQVRRVYLGSVLNLCPSGKYYMPWACSNVMGCAQCGGTGMLPIHPNRRVAKRMQARHKRIMKRFDRLYGPDREAHDRRFPSLIPSYQPSDRKAAYAYIASQPERYRMRHLSGPSCMACGGTGSREAHLDSLWREDAENAFSAMGLSLESGEGDGCDLFAAEYRETPDTDEDGNEGEEHPENGTEASP